MIRRLLTGIARPMVPRRVIMMAALVVAWCVLWGTVSAANLLSGLLVALLVTTPGLGGALDGGFRPKPFARLMWLILIDLMKSTIAVSYEILRLRGPASESIVAVTVPVEARRHLLLYTAAITLTPGTVVVDTDVDSGTLYVHLLDDADVAGSVAHVQRMAELAVRSFPPRSQGSASAVGDLA